MATNKLTIVQHNCLNWHTNFLSLCNTYREIDPDIMLLNLHGNHSDNRIKLFGYNSIQINATNERHDGSTILIKNNLQDKQIENFRNDTAIEIKLIYDSLIIGTLYSPPRRPQPPTEDIISNHHGRLKRTP